MITMLLVAIIMLNALIAIMGDTYDRVSETRLERGLQGRALLLIEIEEAMTIMMCRPSFHAGISIRSQAFFPRWFYLHLDHLHLDHLHLDLHLDHLHLDLHLDLHLVAGCTSSKGSRTPTRMGPSGRAGCAQSRTP